MFTKNGMPFVREAVASLEAEGFEDYELVVQDAASTDGTVEFFRELRHPNLRLVSEQDAGLGDAYNRAFWRCTGDIVGTLDADNLLLPNALATIDAFFREHRGVTAVYGAVQMIDEARGHLGLFVPGAFDRRALMRCELVPPMSTTYFDRRRCGNELRGDSSLTAVQDFDLFLRLSARKIVRSTAVLGATRLSPRSMTRNAENYELFCAEKIAALERFIDAHPELEGERDEAVAGIYCWAAESILDIEGLGPRFESFVRRAEKFGSDEERLKRLVDQVRHNGSTSDTR
jgi:glycosyltransferase involved in cell wall biosynthesis